LSSNKLEIFFDATIAIPSSSSLVDPEEIYGLVLQEAVTIKCPDKKITGVLNLKQ
jgi:hypothetical protein